MIKGACVVDEDVNRTEVADDAPHGLLDVAPVRDVALDRSRAPAEFADLPRRRLGVDEPLRTCGLRHRPVPLGFGPGVRLDLDVGDDDVRARTRERQRIGTAEPPRAARDEGNPAGQVDLERQATRVESEVREQ